MLNCWTEIHCICLRLLNNTPPKTQPSPIGYSFHSWRCLRCLEEIIIAEAVTYWDVFYYLVVATWRPEHQLQMLISPDVRGKCCLFVFLGGDGWLGGGFKKKQLVYNQRFGGGEYLQSPEWKPTSSASRCWGDMRWDLENWWLFPAVNLWFLHFSILLDVFF